MRYTIAKRLEAGEDFIAEPVFYEDPKAAADQAICSMGRGFETVIMMDVGGAPLPHVESAGCWCNPAVEHHEDGELIIHNGVE